MTNRDIVRLRYSWTGCLCIRAIMALIAIDNLIPENKAIVFMLLVIWLSIEYVSAYVCVIRSESKETPHDRQSA